jgi:hypothetical protein
MQNHKKKRKRSMSGTVTLDGFDLRWELHSEPQFTTEHGYKGLCISAQLMEGVHRELMLEYPFPKKQPNVMAHFPESPKISQSVVEADILRAMDAGWNPASRGKPFVFRVPDISN